MVKVNFFIVMLVGLFFTNSIKAQSVEWEVLNVGLTFGYPTVQNIGKVEEPAMILGSEVRLNLYEKRISPGVQFSLSGWNREFKFSEDTYMQHQQALMFMVVTDYNFTDVHSKVMPFCGVGLGLSSVKNDNGGDVLPDETLSHLIASPRIGVEILDKFRITSEYRYQGNSNNFFVVKLGFVIGK